jgi:hypothetical protein
MNGPHPLLKFNALRFKRWWSKLEKADLLPAIFKLK